MLDSDDLNNLYPKDDKDGKKKKGMKEIFIMSKLKKGKKKVNNKVNNKKKK
jgi:hypothetical protein